MGRKQKYSKAIKLLAINQYKEGTKSITEIAKDLGCHVNAIYDWLRIHESIGVEGFDEKRHNQAYTKELKKEIIDAYLEGMSSSIELAKRYHIPTHSMIIKWVSTYNRHKEIKAYDPKGYVYMAKTRKVSFEEKLEIIKWTIEHDNAYKLAAEKFETSYAQVFNWVKKFKAHGEESLQDSRGKRKPIENLTEIEKLKREVELLRRKNERLEMEAEVIKKFQEIERRDILARSVKKQNTKR